MGCKQDALDLVLARRTVGRLGRGGLEHLDHRRGLLLELLKLKQGKKESSVLHLPTFARSRQREHAAWHAST